MVAQQKRGGFTQPMFDYFADAALLFSCRHFHVLFEISKEEKYHHFSDPSLDSIICFACFALSAEYEPSLPRWP